MEELLIRLGMDVGGAPEAWRVSYARAASSYPPGGPDFLTDDYIDDANTCLRLNAAQLAAVKEAAALVRASGDLSMFVWLWFVCVFDDNAGSPARWPVPECLNAYSGMPHALIYISALPRLKKYYESLNIDEAILADTVSDIAFNMDEYKIKFGEYGVGEYRAEWLLNHFTGRLFMLGRLQFMHMPFPDETDFLPKGADILEVHIQSGAPLSRETCGASYAQALEFYKRRFLALDIKAFTCSSWLLSPEIAALLPEGSNIVKFQNDYNVYKIGGNCYDDMLAYVFDTYSGPYAGLPEDTSLRRKVKVRMTAGAPIRFGYGVMMV